MVKSNKLEQTSEGSSKNRSHNVSGELTYQLSPQDLITASYSQYASDNNNNYTQLVKQQNAAGELFQSYQNLNNGKGEAAGHDLSLNYEHSFKKNDQQLLTFSFNTSNSSSSSNSDFTLKPLLNSTGRVSTTYNKDNTREKTLQADYVQSIGSRRWK